MVKRKISVEHYIKVGFLTVLVFCLGVALGIIIDNERISWLMSKSREQEVRYQGLQIQYLYLNTLEDTDESCPVLETALEDSIADLGATLETLEEYRKNSGINKKEYDLINQRYVLDNLRYWLFVKRLKKVCKKDLVTILYFYSTDNCPICPDQGVVLTYYKKIFDDRLLIFPINVDLEEDVPMISILRTQYNITQYPTIILEEQKHEGVISKEHLGKYICSSFKSLQPECRVESNEN